MSFLKKENILGGKEEYEEKSYFVDVMCIDATFGSSM